MAFEPAAIDDLRARLRNTRWPERETVDDWSQGIPLAFVQDLATYWCDEYDFVAAQERMNAWPQFTTRIDDLDIHFVHARSPEPDAVPLVITHGWPGSVVEFFDVLGPLTDPVAHGGDAADAFHVVCPSLPGYGFSDRPSTRGPRRPVDRGGMGDADEPARLRALRRAGRRLGLGRDQHRRRDAPATASLGIHVNMPTVPLGPLTDDATEQRARELRRLRVAHAVGHRLPASSSPPGPRPWATGSSTRRSGSSRGSSRSSGRGPTATAIRSTSSPATSCSTT